MHRPPAPTRVLRGLVVAVVGLGVASAGHGFGGGGGDVVVSPPAVLVALLVTAASVLVSRTVWTAGRLVVALLGMQVAMHAAFWVESGARTPDARLSALVTSPGAHAHAHMGAASVSPVAMVAAHVVAVLASALLLAAADAALTVIRALAARLLRGPVAAPATAVRPVVPAARQVVVVRVWELGAVGRRGPPPSPAPA